MCSEPTVSAYGVWVSCVQSLLRTQLTHEEGTLPGDLETQLEELYDELSLSGPVMPEPAPDVASPPSNVHGSYGLPEHSLPSPADPPQQLGPAVMSPAPPATCFENSKAPKPYFEGPKQPGPVVLPTSPEPCVPSPADPAKHLLGPAVMGAAPTTVPAKLCLEGPTLPRPVLLPTPAEAPLPSPTDPAEHLGPAVMGPTPATVPTLPPPVLLATPAEVPLPSLADPAGPVVMGPKPAAVPAKLCLEGPTLAQPVLLATPAEAPLPGPADPAEHLGPAATPCMGPAPTAVPAKLCLGDPTLPQPALLATPAEAPLPGPADPPQHLGPAVIGPATATTLQQPTVPAKAEGPTPAPSPPNPLGKDPCAEVANLEGPMDLGPAVIGHATATTLQQPTVPAKAEGPTPAPSPPNPLGKDPCAEVANLEGPMDL